MNRILVIICIVLSPLFAEAAIRQVSPQTINEALEILDNKISNRDIYIEKRANKIDSLKTLLRGTHTSADSLQHIMQIGKEYTSFNNDSALHYFSLGMEMSVGTPQELPFKMRRATLLPLQGLNFVAIEEYESINPDSLDSDNLVLYYEGKRQMFSYVSSYYSDFPSYSRAYNDSAVVAQSRLIELLPKTDPIYALNIGEYFYKTGQTSKAQAVLMEVIQHEPTDSNIRARAAHILSQIARNSNDEDLWFYYLILAADSDISSATLEVASLQELGVSLYDRGDIDRAYKYLYTALENAVACHASMRMLQTASALPVIEKAYNDKIASWNNRLYILLGVLLLFAIVLGLVLFKLRHKMQQMSRLQSKLAHANEIKEVYISRFLSLCSIYMDKLNQLGKLIERKISSGNVDDLYRLTKSGKFVEEQSHAFYDVFDDAFLHIYPTFVEDVNALLRPDEQIVLKDGERMNTDLRILAFMRLGMEDSQRIAQVLNYSIHTIYTYRNKLKCKAINRDTFEDDVMSIGKPQSV